MVWYIKNGILLYDKLLFLTQSLAAMCCVKKYNSLRFCDSEVMHGVCEHTKNQGVCDC